MTYETIQRWIVPDGGKLGLLSTILAGGFAGIANWVVGIPPDVLKSRLQAGMYFFLVKIIFDNFCFLYEFILSI